MFHRFKEALFSFDGFLSTCDSGQKIVGESEEFSWRLKFLDLDEFPVMDWDERVKGIVSAIDAYDPGEAGDPNLGNKVLGYLGYLEQLVNQIGIACIHQIALGIYAKIAVKTLALLGLLVVTLVLTSTSTVIPVDLVIAAPAFFGALTVLMLYEIGWWLYRESEEPLTFVEGREDG
ncbi:hypothetical protein [Ectothiorhodospira mobilis]|uniref:hypothetical protein n=1 Tax=Ectothiorhodospira mobilis TaxID=195064 RepID=UPI000B85898D|nr:hypothetical protein [Ectothiorhodospira mobilis]